MKFIQPLIFVGLPFIAGRTRWKISTKYTDIAKIGTYYPAFIITLLYAAAIFNVVRLYPGKNSHPTIAFLLCRVPKGFVTQCFYGSTVHIVFTGFYFLQANNFCRVR